MISRIILVALTMAILAISLFAYFTDKYGAAYGQTIAFCALVVMQWANAFNARSTFESVFRRIRVINKPFYVGLTISVVLQVLAIFGPLQGLLHIHPVGIGDLFVVSLAVFIALIIVVEIHKYFGRRFIKNPIE